MYVHIFLEYVKRNEEIMHPKIFNDVSVCICLPLSSFICLFFLYATHKLIDKRE